LQQLVLEARAACDNLAVIVEKLEGKNSAEPNSPSAWKGTFTEGKR